MDAQTHIQTIQGNIEDIESHLDTIREVLDAGDFEDIKLSERKLEHILERLPTESKKACSLKLQDFLESLKSAVEDTLKREKVLLERIDQAVAAVMRTPL